MSLKKIIIYEIPRRRLISRWIKTLKRFLVLEGFAELNTVIGRIIGSYIESFWIMRVWIPRAVLEGEV